jgi:hypothetical protein
MNKTAFIDEFAMTATAGEAKDSDISEDAILGLTAEEIETIKAALELIDSDEFGLDPMAATVGETKDYDISEDAILGLTAEEIKTWEEYLSGVSDAELDAFKERVRLEEFKERLSKLSPGDYLDAHLEHCLTDEEIKQTKEMENEANRQCRVSMETHAALTQAKSKCVLSEDVRIDLYYRIDSALLHRAKLR